VELDARKWGAQSKNATESPAGARFGMTSLGARACWTALQTSSTTLDVAPCVGADVHLISASGYGADTNYGASARWTTLAAGGLLRAKITSWLALRSRIEAFAALSRPTFVVENTGQVYRPPTLGAAASLGVEVLFL
jgi:hypothetical protein